MPSAAAPQVGKVMIRIFSFLAALDWLALLAAFGVGLLSWQRDGLNRDPAVDAIYLVHYQVGLYASFGNLLVHCLVMTYFLGTGRMVKEICLAYELPDAQWPRVTRDLKRRNTPWALLAMGLTIACAAAGQGNQMKVWPGQVHLALAVAVLVFNAGVFVREYHNIRTNGGVLDAVMAEVDRVRAERGLPSNAEALRQEEG
jgi:hypothetical protein